MKLDIIGVFGIALTIAVLVTLKIANIRQARKRAEFEAHSRWLMNRNAYELNRSTPWQG